MAQTWVRRAKQQLAPAPGPAPGRLVPPARSQEQTTKQKRQRQHALHKSQRPGRTRAGTSTHHGAHRADERGERSGILGNGAKEMHRDSVYNRPPPRPTRRTEKDNRRGGTSCTGDTVDPKGVGGSAPSRAARPSAQGDAPAAEELKTPPSMGQSAHIDKAGHVAWTRDVGAQEKT